MITNLSLITVTIEGKQYHLLCAPDSPIANIKQAIFDISKIVGQVEDGIKKQQETEKSIKEEEKTDIEAVI